MRRATGTYRALVALLRTIALVLIVVAASGCGGLASLRGMPTIAPLISATFLSVHLFVGDGGDAQERARLPELRDSIAGALPAAWSVATRGRGKLALRTDADIDVKLDGTSGTSALMQHKLGGRVVSQTITVHSVAGSSGAENVRTISLPVRTPETSWPSERSAASTASPCGSRTSVFGRTSTRATNLTRASFRRRAGSTRDSGPSFP